MLIKSNWRAGDFAFYAFLLYTVLIWSCELLDLFCWLTGIPQVTFISRVAYFAFTVFGWRVIGVPRVKRVKIDAYMVLGSILIAGFFAVKGIRPDMSYDTLQLSSAEPDPGFTDNLNYHVMPGKFQMFGFRLGTGCFIRSAPCWD